MTAKDKVYRWIKGLIDAGELRVGETFNLGNLAGYAPIFECSTDAIHGILSSTKKYSVLPDNGIDITVVSNRAKNYKIRLDGLLLEPEPPPPPHEPVRTYTRNEVEAIVKQVLANFG